MYATCLKSRWRRVVVFAFTIFVSGPGSLAQGTSAGFHLGIGVITPRDGPEASRAASIARGVRLGAAEASQTAALFGDHVELLDATGSGATALAAATRMLAGGKVAILVGTTTSDAAALSQLAESHHVLFFNAASRLQALRSLCRRYTFHIEATDAMYANAVRLGAPSGQITSGRRAAHAPSLRNDSVLLWSPSLVRFGASQLNERYLNKYRLGMDGGAWAGWAAVKIATDAALRAQSAQPQKLLAYLESPSTEFDGHKGWQLTFRAADHQLRQPLYMVVPTMQNSSTVTSVRDVPELHALPEQAGAEQTSARPSDRVLDALVASPDARTCRWSGR